MVPYVYLILMEKHNFLGLLRISEYSDIHGSDIRGSEYKIEYEYLSLPKSLDRDLFFFFLQLKQDLTTETRSFSQKLSIEIFPMTTVLINNVSHLNTFVSRR